MAFGSTLHSVGERERSSGPVAATPSAPLGRPPGWSDGGVRQWDRLAELGWDRLGELEVGPNGRALTASAAAIRKSGSEGM